MADPYTRLWPEESDIAKVGEHLIVCLRLTVIDDEAYLSLLAVFGLVGVNLGWWDHSIRLQFITLPQEDIMGTFSS